MGLIAMLGFPFLAGTSSAETEAGSSQTARTPEQEWLPGFALQTGLLAQKRIGDSRSLERGVQEGDSSFLFAHFGASLDLTTPAIPGLPIPVRAFARADVFTSFDEKESLATESDPGNPLFDLAANLEGGSTDGIIGTGTTLRVQAEPVIFSGGFGLTFSTEVGGRALRIKPSVEWMYQRDEIVLRFADIESESSNPDQCLPCRTTSLKSQTTKAFHSLGPGVEADLDAGRVGAFRVSIYSQFRALRILGNRKAELRATSSWFTRTIARVDGQNVITSIDPAVGRADSTVVAHYRREPWGYFLAAGFRFVWSPESSGR